MGIQPVTGLGREPGSKAGLPLKRCKRVAFTDLMSTLEKPENQGRSGKAHPGHVRPDLSCALTGLGEERVQGDPRGPGGPPY